MAVGDRTEDEEDLGKCAAEKEVGGPRKNPKKMAAEEKRARPDEQRNRREESWMPLPK